jgi:hypothetical protein
MKSLVKSELEAELNTRDRAYSDIAIEAETGEIDKHGIVRTS